MTWTEIVVFGSLLGVLWISFILSSLVWWARLSALDDSVEALKLFVTERAEPKALEDAKILAQTTADRVDNAMADLRKFREGIHAEIQRFYGIMRRNEKAVEREAQAEEEDHPDRIPLSDVQGSDENQVMSRAALRDLARKKGHRI